MWNDIFVILGIATHLGVLVAVVCAAIARRRSGQIWRRTHEN